MSAPARMTGVAVTRQTRQTLSLAFFENAGSAGAAPRAVAIDNLVVAGWTGRDAAAVEKHIHELEALGVKRPAATPIFYRVAAVRLTTATEIEAVGEHSGGEVEFVLLQHRGRLWVGTGSDHTDRAVETYGVTVSKQMCDKPVAPAFWAFDDVASHWDRLVLRAHVIEGGERKLYQEGPVATMLAPLDLIGRYVAAEKGDAEKGFGDKGLAENTRHVLRHPRRKGRREADRTIRIRNRGFGARPQDRSRLFGPHPADPRMTGHDARLCDPTCCSRADSSGDRWPRTSHGRRLCATGDPQNSDRDPIARLRGGCHQGDEQDAGCIRIRPGFHLHGCRNRRDCLERAARDRAFLAEREGFEPPIRLPVCRISSAVHSTTLPPLRRVELQRCIARDPARQMLE